MLSHKIRIYPNKEQEILLNKSCGVSRFAWNWALDKWNTMYDNNEKPTFFKVKEAFNKFKMEQGKDH